MQLRQVPVPTKGDIWKTSREKQKRQLRSEILKRCMEQSEDWQETLGNQMFQLRIKRVKQYLEKEDSWKDGVSILRIC